MKKFMMLIIVLTLIVVQLFAQNSPRNLIANPYNGYVNLHWEEPIPEIISEIGYHDSIAVQNESVYLADYGYGVNFDLSDYDNPKLLKMRFHKTNKDNLPNSNICYYNVFVIDTYANYITNNYNGLMDSVATGWTPEINLNYTSGFATTGIFINPVTNVGGAEENYYPCLSMDADTETQSSLIYNLSSFTPESAENTGDFLVDLWISTNDRGILKITSTNKYKKSKNDAKKIHLPEPEDYRHLDGYRIYRDNIPFQNIVHSLEFVDQNVINGISYNYYIRAIYGNIESQSSNSQTAIPFGIGDVTFCEDFESGLPLPNNWTRIDNDGDGFNWKKNSEGIDPYEGSGCMWSQSFDNELLVPLFPDNYLITSQINLQAPAELSFWVKAQDEDFIEEHYYLKLSTFDNQVENFTEILFSETIDVPEWHQVIVDLSDYYQQPFYLAWNHTDVSDMYAIKIDDIKIIYTAENPNNDQEIEQNLNKITNYPNPFNPNTTIKFFIEKNNSNVDLKIYNVQGKLVKNLFSGKMNLGIKNILWNGKNESFDDVATGIYYYKICIENKTFIKKMLLIK